MGYQDPRERSHRRRVPGGRLIGIAEPPQPEFAARLADLLAVDDLLNLLAELSAVGKLLGCFARSPDLAGVAFAVEAPDACKQVVARQFVGPLVWPLVSERQSECFAEHCAFVFVLAIVWLLELVPASERQDKRVQLARLVPPHLVALATHERAFPLPVWQRRFRLVLVFPQQVPVRSLVRCQRRQDGLPLFRPALTTGLVPEPLQP